MPKAGWKGQIVKELGLKLRELGFNIPEDYMEARSFPSQTIEVWKNKLNEIEEILKWLKGELRNTNIKSTT